MDFLLHVRCQMEEKSLSMAAKESRGVKSGIFWKNIRLVLDIIGAGPDIGTVASVSPLKVSICSIFFKGHGGSNVSQLLKNEYVDYIGFANLGKYEEKLARYGGEIVRGYRFGISVGIALPDSTSNSCRAEAMQTLPANTRSTAIAVITVSMTGRILSLAN